MPSLPGCVSRGEKREEALKTIELYLETDEDELVRHKRAEIEKITI